jgi:hypothetical protein
MKKGAKAKALTRIENTICFSDAPKKEYERRPSPTTSI